MLIVDSEELFQQHAGKSEDYGAQPQAVTVRGPITYVGPDMFGLPCIELGDEQGGATRVNCVFSDLDYSSIPESGHATISGTDEGYAYEQVVVKQAHLVSTVAD